MLVFVIDYVSRHLWIWLLLDCHGCRQSAANSQQPTANLVRTFFFFCSPRNDTNEQWHNATRTAFFVSFDSPSHFLRLAYTFDCFHYISSGISFIFIFSIVCKFAHLLETIFLFNDFCKTYTFLILHVFNVFFSLLAVDSLFSFAQSFVLDALSSGVLQQHVEYRSQY